MFTVRKAFVAKRVFSNEAELDCYETLFDDESLKMSDELNEEMLIVLVFSLGHVKEVNIGELYLEEQLIFTWQFVA